MSHIVSYLKRQKEYSFSDKPFNEVDALILSQFVYLKLDNLIPNTSEKKEWVYLYDISNRMNYDKVFEDKRYAKDNKALLKAMVESRRYRNMRLNYFSQITSVAAETQFAAITCFLEEGPIVIVYRGTDETLVGWKEDFNMFFKEPVMGQSLSRMYLKQVSELIEGHFIITGHSKGGNFAVYASMNAEEEIQERIDQVYSFDSPGFRPEILESVDFNKIKEKIHKFLPKSSFFGMILQSNEDYEVVDCSSVGLMQHNLYKWQVEGERLKRNKELDKSSLFLNETFNEWLYGLNEDELHAFAEIWYVTLRQANVTTILDFMKEPAKSLTKLAGVIKETDEETKTCVKELTLSLIKVVHEHREKKGLSLRAQLERFVIKELAEEEEEE
ncbi:MAG: DUF2974 domain-containing protein [Lachnospiraceae bacterium]|nr:DUF2974 domain-containing protein [Lachnospiraceae bacterium]